MTDFNYLIVIPVLLVLIVLLYLFLRKNNKDRKKFRRDLNASEVKPGKHDDDEPNI